MRKIGKIVFGGLEQKIYTLVLIAIILTVSAFMWISSAESQTLRELVAESSADQNAAVMEISSQTMDAVLEKSLTRTTELQARIADTAFYDAGQAVAALVRSVDDLYHDPGAYSAYPIEIPSAENDGTFVMQLVTEENVDLQNKAIETSVGLLGNLKHVMETLVNSGKVNAAYFGTEDGLLIIMDNQSSSKINEDGTIRTIDVRNRHWYKAAVEKGERIYSDLEFDAFNNRLEVVCAEPVYINGCLVGVAGADLYLDNIQELNAADTNAGSFEMVINGAGHVISGPSNTGTLAPHSSEEAVDLRESENEELAAFVSDALASSTDVRLITVDGYECYVTGAPLPTIGWALVYVVDRKIMDQQGDMMVASMEAIQQKSTAQFYGKMRQLNRIMIALIVLVTVVAVTLAVILARKIVKPLNSITRKIADLSDSNLQFMMEDAYRTGDEIEVLAESFAAISEKTVRYIRQIASVTAENERINTELDMAKSIQESQLPSIFPPYPNRPDFDIYASMTPAREVGGDFYDFFLVDDDHLCLVIADVSGKGVPAALFMMISKILIKNRIMNGEPPGMALENVNRQLQEGGETDMFVTVWLCLLDIRTGKGIVANAGHEHPALRRAGGKYELLVYRHSPALGMMPDMVFAEHEFQMRSGDSLFVYTDGVPEATDAHNEMFGTDRMLEALNADPDASVEAILASVRNSVNAFVKEAEQFDDLTMLCLEYKG